MESTNTRKVLTKVKKRDGSVVDFDLEKIGKVILSAAQAIGGKDQKRSNWLAERVVEDLSNQFTDKRPPTVEDVQDSVERILMNHSHVRTAKSFILYRDRRRKLREERLTLVGSTEQNNLSLNAIRLLRERYLLRDEKGVIHETPNEMFRRVAKSVALAEKKYKKGDVEKATNIFYDMMFNLDFLPNTPTLMNAGTKHPQLLSCFVLPVEDSVFKIFRTLRTAMKIQKRGSGTGFSFSSLRPRGSLVSSNGKLSSGPVPFIHVFNEATGAIKQGGTGRGANMGVLRVDHPDIIEFIRCKDEDGRMTNFNISVGVTDQFMEAVGKREDYDLKDPISGKHVSSVEARYVWDSIVASAWRYGDPGILFLDRINKDNVSPKEPISGTSPCAEAPLLPNESCMLGSINLGNFVVNETERTIDWKRLEETVHQAVRFLDNALDVSSYPTADVKERSLAYRKIGLGIMGFADMLIKLRVAYNSEKGVSVAEGVMSFIRKEADKASQQLAEERGAFDKHEESCYAGRKKKFRNATRLSIAPTGSLSMIADCSSGIEPLFAISYVKRVMGGKQFFYVDGNFREALKEHKLDKEEIIEQVINQSSIGNIEDIPPSLRRVFVVAHDISPEWHIKMQAAMQKHVDNAISKTVNFPHTATMKDIEKVYMYAWRNGCKGITIYRDGSKAEQVVNLSF